MTVESTAVAVQSPDLLIQIAPEDEYGFFDSMKPKQQVLSAKVNHITGQFEVANEDGTVDLLDALVDVVTIIPRDGQIHWDPTAEEGSGKFICKSSDGRMPDPGGAFKGPCHTCLKRKWPGTKDAKGKPVKPDCDDTLAVFFARTDGSPFVLRAAKTSLKGAKEFFTKNFYSQRRKWYTRFVTVTLQQEMHGTKPYYVIKFTLGDPTDAEIQAEAHEMWKLSKDIMESLAVEYDGDPGDGGGEAAAPAASPQAAGQPPADYQPPAPPQTWTQAPAAAAPATPPAAPPTPPPAPTQVVEVQSTPVAPPTPPPAPTPEPAAPPAPEPTAVVPPTPQTPVPEPVAVMASQVDPGTPPPGVIATEAQLQSGGKTKPTGSRSLFKK